MSQQEKPVVENLSSSSSRTTTEPAIPSLKSETKTQSTVIGLDEVMLQRCRELAKKFFAAQQLGEAEAKKAVDDSRFDRLLLILPNGRSAPLFVAAEKGELEVVKYLLNLPEGRAAVNQTDKGGQTPLFVAVGWGKLEVVKCLLDVPEGRATVNQTDKGGQTPLFVAVGRGDLEVVRCLLSLPEGRATVNQADKGGRTPLFVAAERRNLEVVKCLLNLSEGRATVNQADNGGQTPLLVAAEKGELEVVKCLLNLSEGRATVNQADKGGRTPLLVAAEKGKLEVVKCLLNLSEGRATVNQADKGGRTPLLVAAEKGKLEVVKYLLAFPEGRATVNQADKGGRTPLFVAVEWGKLEVVQYLLNLSEGRAIVNHVDNKGRTLLFIAAEGEHLEVVKLLLKAPQIITTVDQADENGQTPLAALIMGGFHDALVEVGAVLLDHGANIKVAEEWLTNKSFVRKDLYSNASQLSHIKTRAQSKLKLIIEHYQKKFAAPTLPKTEFKQEVGNTHSPSSRLSQTTVNTLTAALSPHVIQNIKSKLKAGNVEPLLAQLTQPAGTIAAGSEMGVYLEQQALTDIIKVQAQGSKKAELKNSQHANLTKAMEEVLKTDPLAVIRPNKEEGGLTPLDTAIKLGLPEKVINRLQQAEQVVYDNQITALQKHLAQESLQDPKKAAELVSSLTNSVAELKAVRNKVNQLPTTVTSTPLASSSTTTASTTTALVNAPVGLSVAQQAQIELGEQFLRIKLTQVFVEALAIKYGLVDGFNQSRTAAVAKGAFILIASLVPIPGASLLVQGIVEGVEFGVTKGAQAAVEDHDKELRTGRIGKEIETIEQAAEYVAVLTKDLTRRFQLVFAQLAPESLEVFVNRVVDRMVDYWDMMPEKLKEAKASRELLHERLVDCTQKTLQLLPSSSGQGLTQNQRFDNLIENLLLGASLWNEDREIDASGRLAGVAAGTGKLAKAAGFVIGDRAVYWQNAQSSQRVAVRHVCRHAPAVTWTGLNHQRNGPTYYYGRPAASSNASIDNNLPPLYFSEAECSLRNYVVDQSKPAPLSLHIGPKELVLSDAEQLRRAKARIEQLEQQLKAAESRADNEKARADAALEQVKEAKAMSVPQKLPISETKEMSISRTSPASLPSKWTPRAVGQIPLSPSSPSEPPDKSLSTQADSTLTPMSPTATS